MNNFNTARWDNSLLDSYMGELDQEEWKAERIDARADERIAEMGIGDLREIFEFSEADSTSILAAIKTADATNVGHLVYTAVKRWARSQATHDIECNPL